MDAVSTEPKVKKIFIQRDYSKGTGVMFCTEFPSELNGKVGEEVYRATLNHVNEIFDKAEALSCRTVTEGCFSCLTGYTLHYCFKTYYERCVEEVSKFLQRENRDKYESKGIIFGDPMDRGLRCIEINITVSLGETGM